MILLQQQERIYAGYFKGGSVCGNFANHMQLQLKKHTHTIYSQTKRHSAQHMTVFYSPQE